MTLNFVLVNYLLTLLMHLHNVLTLMLFIRIHISFVFNQLLTFFTFFASVIKESRRL